MRQIGEYEILGTLGEGAESTVFLAKKGAESYALKVRNKLSNAISGELRGEFTALARANHPNLVRVYECVENEDCDFLVMERIDGVLLAALLANGPLSESQLCLLAKEIAASLASLHRHSILHRDVKPQNIFQTRKGSWQLIDLGLAANVRKSGAAGSSTVGTFAYSSPEQLGVLDRPLDFRSDLYSLGAVLYEAATGTPPFDCSDLEKLFRAHASSTPKPVRNTRPEISPILAAVIEKLLAKDPDDRYPSAEALQRDLENLSKLATWIAGGDLTGLGVAQPGDGAQTPFIGQSQALSDLQKNWEVGISTCAQRLVITADKGLGKSRLLGEYYRKSEAPLKLYARASAADSRNFSTLTALLHSYLRELRNRAPAGRHKAETEMREAASDLTSQLGLLSPILREFFEPLRASRSFGEVEDHNLLYREIAQFIVRLSKSSGPILLMIDDYEYCDASSLKVFAELSRVFGDCKGLWLCTIQRDRFTGGVLPWASDYQEIQLGPLPSGDLERLVVDLLGGHSLPPELVKNVVRRAEGNPLLLAEYVNALLESGGIRFSRGKWEAMGNSQASIPLSSDVIEMLVSKVERLEAKTKKVIVAAALCGSEFRSEWISTLLDFDRGVVLYSLSRALEGHILVPGEKSGTYRFVHDRVAEMLRNSVTDEERDRADNLLIEEIERNAELRSHYIKTLAKLYGAKLASKGSAKAYTALRDAGEEAYFQFALDEAFGFLNQAYQLGSELGLAQDPAMLRILGEICYRTQKLELGMQVLLDAIKLETVQTEQAAIYERLARIAFGRYQVQDARKYLVLGFEALGESEPRASFKHLLLTLKDWGLGTWLRVTGLGYGSADEKEARHTRVLLKLYDLAGYLGMFDFNPASMFQAILRPLPKVHRLGDSAEFVMTYTAYSTIWAAMGRRKSCEKFARLAADCAKRIKDPVAVNRAETRWVTLPYFYGELRDCEARLGPRLDRVLKWTDFIDSVSVYLIAIQNQSYRGHVSELPAIFDELCQRYQLNPAFECSPENLTMVWARLFFLTAQIFQGDFNRAAKALAETESFLKRIDASKMLWASYLQVNLQYLVETDDLGAAFEHTVQKYKQLGMNPATSPLQWKLYYVHVAYGRLKQHLSSSSAEAASARQSTNPKAAFDSSLKDLGRAANLPFLKVHFTILNAWKHAISGASDKALRLLAEAETDAYQQDNSWALYETTLARAWIFEKLGDSVASRRAASSALQISLAEGWSHRAEAVAKKHELGRSRGSFGHGHEYLSKSSHSSETRLLPSALAQHDLVQLSLSLAKLYDPQEQSRAVLDGVIRFLGAERAFLFIFNKSKGVLEWSCGRDAAGNNVEEAFDYSRTLVSRVGKLRAPLVLSGSEKGAIEVTESVVVHGLKSMMAAPLLLRDEVLGVVYLDNKLAKGVFTEKHCDILMVLANQIVVALETARMTFLEIERNSAVKELEKKRAVQEILDNLDQGFFSFDSRGIVLPGVSRAARGFFGENIEGRHILEVLAVPPDAIGEEVDWAKLLFDEPIAFEDIPKFDELKKDSGRLLELKYRPIRDHSGKIEKVIVVADDATVVRALQAKSDADAARVKMILVMIENREIFSRGLRSLQELANGALQLLNHPNLGEVMQDLKSKLHTAKGLASTLWIRGVTRRLHGLEDKLLFGDLSHLEAKSGLEAILKDVEEVWQRYGALLSGVVDGQGLDVKGVEVERLRKFGIRLSESLGASHLLAKEFSSVFLTENVSGVIKSYALAVSNAAESLSKKVRFTVADAPVRMDLTPYRAVFDSLVHVFRNAVDHGIESTDERLKSGKSEVGEIVVVVSETASTVQIQIHDDGRGIDLNQVRSLAVQKGLISSADAQRLTPEAVHGLLFAPDFSTRKEVSELSGRGVGLDAVLREVKKMGGNLTLTSKKGHGTTVMLSLSKDVLSEAGAQKHAA